MGYITFQWKDGYERNIRIKQFREEGKKEEIMNLRELEDEISSIEGHIRRIFNEGVEEGRKSTQVFKDHTCLIIKDSDAKNAGDKWRREDLWRLQREVDAFVRAMAIDLGRSTFSIEWQIKNLFEFYKTQEK